MLSQEPGRPKSKKTRNSAENVCIQSNIFCNEEELGDGICQAYNNGPLCDHDLGDCCLATGNQTNFTCNSECFLDAYYQIPYFIG